MKESHRYRTPTAKGFEDPSENFGYAIFEADRDTTTVGDNYHIKFENPIRLVEAVGEFRKSVPVNNPLLDAYRKQPPPKRWPKGSGPSQSGSPPPSSPPNNEMCADGGPEAKEISPIFTGPQGRTERHRTTAPTGLPEPWRGP